MKSRKYFFNLFSSFFFLLFFFCIINEINNGNKTNNINSNPLGRNILIFNQSSIFLVFNLLLKLSIALLMLRITSWLFILWLSKEIFANSWLWALSASSTVATHLFTRTFKLNTLRKIRIIFFLEIYFEICVL